MPRVKKQPAQVAAEPYPQEEKVLEEVPKYTVETDVQGAKNGTVKLVKEKKPRKPRKSKKTSENSSENSAEGSDKVVPSTSSPEGITKPKVKRAPSAWNLFYKQHKTGNKELTNADISKMYQEHKKSLESTKIQK